MTKNAFLAIFEHFLLSRAKLKAIRFLMSCYCVLNVIRRFQTIFYDWFDTRIHFFTYKYQNLISPRKATNRRKIRYFTWILKIYWRIVLKFIVAMSSTNVIFSLKTLQKHLKNTKIHCYVAQKYYKDTCDWRNQVWKNPFFHS